MEQAVSNPLGTERIGKLLVRFGIPSIIDAEDPLALTVPAGTFLCHKIDMAPDIDPPQ